MSADSKLKGKINFQELLLSGTTFHVDPVADINEDASDDEITKEEYTRELLNHANLNCIGEFADDEVYDSNEPFEALASKMQNLVDDGSVKKRILREGYGEKPGEKSTVKVHYNAYTEFNEEPFDCTYARKKPHIFIIGNGAVIPGLDIAVESMKLNEKSQFLIKPELAYGTIGCLDRIPGNATILFEVELLEIIESGAAENFENLPEEKRNQFSEVYKFAMAQNAKAKDLFNRNPVAAIREYNQAVSVLENAQLSEYNEQVKQQELLYKLYSNLLVCYTKVQEPKKACLNFNRINEMSRGTDLKISAKAYYNNAKCLRMLGDYERAKERLRKAYHLEPRNPDILNEFKIIDEEQKKYKEKQLKLAAAFVSSDGKVESKEKDKESK